MNKTVLITGAASGIGRAFADIFAYDGYDMVIVGGNLEKMNAMKTEYERRCRHTLRPGCTQFASR